MTFEDWWEDISDIEWGNDNLRITARVFAEMGFDTGYAAGMERAAEVAESKKHLGPFIDSEDGSRYWRVGDAMDAANAIRAEKEKL